MFLWFLFLVFVFVLFFLLFGVSFFVLLMERTKENEESLVEFCCGICFEVMSWSKVPRMLPCGHSFCSSCLKKITNLGNTKKEKEKEEKKTSKICSCPYCREEFDCDFDCENLKVNSTLSITADLLSSSPSPFSLGIILFFSFSFPFSFFKRNDKFIFSFFIKNRRNEMCEL